MPAVPCYQATLFRKCFNSFITQHCTQHCLRQTCVKISIKQRKEVWQPYLPPMCMSGALFVYVAFTERIFKVLSAKGQQSFLNRLRKSTMPRKLRIKQCTLKRKNVQCHIIQYEKQQVCRIVCFYICMYSLMLYRFVRFTNKSTLQTKSLIHCCVIAQAHLP